MCGRFAQYGGPNRYAEYLKAKRIADVPVKPRYNIAPSTLAWAARDADGIRELVALKWGLVPYFSKTRTYPYNTSNARVETVAINASYRSAFKHRRCIIPADGFYEWRLVAPGRKQPWYHRNTDETPLAIAGLWEIWNDTEQPDVPGLETYTMIVGEANALVAETHDRMPIILDEVNFDEWLDPEVSDQDRLLALLKPYPSEKMMAYPVSTAVNNARNDGPNLIERIA